MRQGKSPIGVISASLQIRFEMGLFILELGGMTAKDIKPIGIVTIATKTIPLRFQAYIFYLCFSQGTVWLVCVSSKFSSRLIHLPHQTGTLFHGERKLSAPFSQPS